VEAARVGLILDCSGFNLHSLIPTAFYQRSWNQQALALRFTGAVIEAYHSCHGGLSVAIYIEHHVESWRQVCILNIRSLESDYASWRHNLKRQVEEVLSVLPAVGC
jgi:hypothetical protein